MMKELAYQQGQYLTPVHSPSFFAKYFPTPVFSCKLIKCVLDGSSLAKRGLYDGEAWSHNSHNVLHALESVGVQLEIRGIEHVRELKEPCIFIGNHMSMLETMILPGVLQPITPITFVIKQSLLEYPVFKHIMRAREPIAVTRSNPRLDLKMVLEGGADRLQAGISIVLFPQTTRTPDFDPAQFNSIGIKLARKANVPIIPMALITDAWANGRVLKDFGKIDPAKKVVFSFGPPIQIEGRGDHEHTQIIEFIQQTIAEER